jgi:hypothetical protein
MTGASEPLLDPAAEWTGLRSKVSSDLDPLRALKNVVSEFTGRSCSTPLVQHNLRSVGLPRLPYRARLSIVAAGVPVHCTEAHIGGYLKL